jgi:DNA-binding transcriptional LysR family regulator
MRKSSLQERTGTLGWEDVRTVLAVVNAGSLSGAARSLDVEHSTVFRRIDDIERRLGTRLFDRERGSYLPNVQAETIAEAGRQMEAAALEAERRVLGADERLKGSIRLATSDLLANYLLPRILDDFLNAHPDIEIEMAVSGGNVDLHRREADLALRATLAPPDTLVGRQLALIDYAVFARYGTPVVADRSNLREHHWIGFDDALQHLQIAQWVKNTIDVRPRVRVDSLQAMLQAVAAGIGVAVLPRFAAAQDGRLVQISEPIDGPRMPIWLLTHPDVRGNARVRALSQHLSERLPAAITSATAMAACADRLWCKRAFAPQRRANQRRRSKTGASPG